MSRSKVMTCSQGLECSLCIRNVGGSNPFLTVFTFFFPLSRKLSTRRPSTIENRNKCITVQRVCGEPTFADRPRLLDSTVETRACHNARHILHFQLSRWTCALCLYSSKMVIDFLDGVLSSRCLTHDDSFSCSHDKVILNGVKFFGHGELFLESLRQVVEILSRSPDYKGGRTAR